MAFQQQFLTERHAGQHLNNLWGSNAFAVRIRHALQAVAELRTFGRGDRVENSENFRRGINHVARAFPALLPEPHVYRGQRERSRLHDSAARISHQDIHLLQQAPVSDGVKIHEHVRPVAGSCECSCTLNQDAAPRVGIRIAEQDLVRQLL